MRSVTSTGLIHVEGNIRNGEKNPPSQKTKKQKENINIVINLLVAYFFSMLICVEAFFYN